MLNAKTASVYLKSTSPYSQSRHYTDEKLRGESADDYEKRTWRSRMHVSPTGLVEIPPMSFANCVKESAKRLGIKVKGKGQRTYTKAFESGVMVQEPLVLDVKPEDVPFDELFVPSDGIPGSGKRVTKFFPRINAWEGEVLFYIMDFTITKEVFAEVLANAGSLVGIGRFRPQNRGYYGRFEVKDLEWSEPE